MSPRAKRPSGKANANGMRDGQSLADATYQSLRRAINRCELAPGRRLTEADLAERYGTGKATVRLALNRLAQDRLIQILPREGYLVAPITLKQMQDLFGARMLIEPAIAREAAGNLSAEQLNELRELSRVSYDRNDPESMARLLAANTEFHVGVARATGNERLVRLARELLDEMERIIHFEYSLGDRSQETYSKHLELIEALETGDGPRAEGVALRHLSEDRRILLEALAGALLTSPTIQDLNLFSISNANVHDASA